MPDASEFISSDGRLMVVDVVIPPGRGAHFGKYVDLNMLVMTGGLERTEDEFRRLLETSGFHLVRVVHPLSTLWKPPRLDPGKQSVLTRKVVTR